MAKAAHTGGEVNDSSQWGRKYKRPLALQFPLAEPALEHLEEGICQPIFGSLSSCVEIEFLAVFDSILTRTISPNLLPAYHYL